MKDNEQPTAESPPVTSDTLSPEVDSFIGSFGLFYEASGGTSSSGRILALLLVISQPLTAEQIAVRLKISRASVSTNVRMLQTAGFVERTVVAGDRRDYYRIPAGGMTTMLELRSSITGALLRLAELGLDVTPANSPARAHMEDFTDMMRFSHEYITNLIPAWLEYKANKEAQRETQN